MRRILYLEPVGGIAGDMFLAAAVDLGVSPEAIAQALSGLKVPGWKLAVSRAVRHAISGTHLDVVLDEREAHPHRAYADIRQLIEAAQTLSPKAKARALEVFRAIGEAEAKVHGVLHRGDPLPRGGRGGLHRGHLRRGGGAGAAGRSRGARGAAAAGQRHHPRGAREHAHPGARDAGAAQERARALRGRGRADDAHGRGAAEGADAHRPPAGLHRGAGGLRRGDEGLQGPAQRAARLAGARGGQGRGPLGGGGEPGRQHAAAPGPPGGAAAGGGSAGRVGDAGGDEEGAARRTC